MNAKDIEPVIPPLDAVYEALADEVEGWASELGIETTYTDPVLEESGRHDWAESLRHACDWATRTAVSLLTADSRIDQAKDLRDRVDMMLAAAAAYEQRLEAAEDQRRVCVEDLVARYRKAFGKDDPDAYRLGRLCEGIQREWTIGDTDRDSPRTPQEFAEAIDWAWFLEDGAKRKTRVEVQRLATESTEHLRLLARIEASKAAPPAPELAALPSSGGGAGAAAESEKPKRGKRGPTRMPLTEAWRYLTVVQAWTDIQEHNRKRSMRNRYQKVQLAEQHGITTQELNAMLGWYAKHRRAGRFPDDPRTLSRDELGKWFE